MAAGQGFKTFATGDVLTASDVNGYLMQGVLVFASAAARDSSITSPQQGQIAFLKDTNSTVYYSGSAWVALGGGGGGKVLQVVTTCKTDTFSSSAASSTYADVTGLSASITPAATTSKIFIVVNAQVASTTGTNRAAVRLVRGSTAIDVGTAAGNRILASTAASSPNTDSIESSGISFLDSPSTTSSTTYTVQIAMLSSGTVYVNRSSSDSDSTVTPRTASTITLLEIGA